MNNKKENFSNSPKEGQDYFKEVRSIYEPKLSRPSGNFEYQSYYYSAGVFQVVCLAKNCAYFTDSCELMFDMATVLKKLQKGIFENKQLVEDFKLFGLENFRFEIVVSGMEYFDEQKRKAALDLAKKSWSGYLY